jgi:hypothetical protein
VSHETRKYQWYPQVRALPPSHATSRKRYTRQLTWPCISRGDNGGGGWGAILLVGQRLKYLPW